MARCLVPLVLAVGVLATPPLSAETVDPTPPVPAASPADPSPWQGAGDGRRTLGRFGANLGHNLVGIVSDDNLKPFLIGAGITGAGSFFDGATERYFAGQHRADGLGSVGATAGSASVMVPLEGALFLAGRASHNPRFRAATYDMAQAALVNGAWTLALKAATQRERPNGANHLSFPSGHSSDAFAFATVAGHYYGPRVGIPAYALAGLIGASRLEQNVHHLSDVLAGAALGLIAGRTVVGRDEEPSRQRRFFVTPTTGPSGTGLGLAVSGHF